MVIVVGHRMGRAWLGLAAALALAVRLLVPAGFMPVSTAEGVVVTLCSAAGSHDVRLDLGGKVPPAEHGAAGDCIFAATAAPLLGSALALPLPIRIVLPTQLLATALGLDLPSRMAAPPPPPIGPPAL